MKKLAILFILGITLQTMAKDFLSQTQIDTTIDNAYYGFVAASSESGGNYTQKSAIAHAKRVVNKLKQDAQTDPNKRYILWRLSELENQIALEEEEVDLHSQYQRVQKINQLVSIFNEELFLERPSFAKLYSLHKRMSKVDIDHANELAENINTQNRYIVSNLRENMRTYLHNREYSNAKTEYHYAIKNRKYLNIGDADYTYWSKTIQAKENADYLKANINNRMRDLDKLLRKKELSKARRNVEVIERDVKGAEKHLSHSFINSTNGKLYGARKKIVAVEDSLVNYNLSLIRGKNTTKATRFMEDVLQPSGVVPEKVARVDRAILSAGATKRKESAAAQAELAILTKTVKSPFMAGMAGDIKQRANILKEKQKRLERSARNHYSQKYKSQLKKEAKKQKKFDKKRVKADRILQQLKGNFETNREAKAVSKFKGKQKFLYQYGSSNRYYYIKKLVNSHNGQDDGSDPEIKTLLKKKAEGTVAGKQQLAMQYTGSIYGKMEDQQTDDALGFFLKHEKLLETYSYTEAFLTLKRTVFQNYSKEHMK